MELLRTVDTEYRKKVNLLQLRRSSAYDDHGRAIRLASIWESKPTLFIFLRHFGCLACRAHADQVWECREIFDRYGANLVFVGNGSVRFLSQFKARSGMARAKFLTDPGLASFGAAGLRRGFLASHGPASLVNAAGLALKGYRQNLRHQPGYGDANQLGGLLLMAPGDRIKYHYISQATGDFPSLDAAIGALTAPDYL